MQDRMAVHFTSQRSLSMNDIHRQFNEYLNQYVNSNKGTVTYDNGYYKILGWLEGLCFAGILDNAQCEIFKATLEKAEAFVLEKHRVYERLSSTIEV